MSGTEILAGVVLLVALPLRVVLDIANIASPKLNLDAAYAVLFGVVAVAMLGEDSKSGWGYAALGVSALFLVIFSWNGKTRTKDGEKK